jgi:hypothetical protein
MDEGAVPQEGNSTLGGHRKLMYARRADGNVVGVPSAGWEVEEIVTTQAVDALAQQAEQAREQVRAGLASPLAYWMSARRMDLALLSQTSGFWQWRVRRHLQPAHFARLSAGQLQRYARALAVDVAELGRLP